MSIVETENNQTTREIIPLIQQGSANAKLNQYTKFDGWGLSYDLNGNTIQRGTQHITYDYRNQLVRAVGVNTTTDFKYDPMGHRVKKIVSTGSQGKTSQYFYDGDHLIEERDGNDNVLKQYIYGNGIDEIIRMDKYEGTTVTSYYFHTDAIGSVTSLTDKDGNLVERVTYDTYGMPTFWDPAGNVIPKSLIGNNILFQGREYDEETNLYYYRARYYDPIMGRFLQTDPMGYSDSMNLYQAFNMNPVNFVDPMGLEWLYSKENLDSLEGEWNYHPGFVKNNVTYRFLVVVKKSKNYYNPGTTKTEYFDIVFYDNDKKIASMENAFSGGTIENGKEYDAIPKCNYYGMLDEIDSKGPQEKAKGIPNLMSYEGIQKIPNRELSGMGDDPLKTWNPYPSYGPIRLRLHPFNGKKWRIYFHGQNPVHGDTHGCLSYGANTDIINKLWNLAETTPKKDKLKVVFAVDVKVNEPLRSAK